MLAQVEFSNIAVADKSNYWYEVDRPERDFYPFDRSTAQYVSRQPWVEGADLPFDVTILNRSSSQVLLTHAGVEVVSVAHLFASPYKGNPPEAVKVKLKDSYDISIPHDSEIWEVLRFDPDEDTWLDVGKFYWTRLRDPVYLEPGAPYRFVLCVREYNLPDHVILRLVMRSGDASVSSHEITVFLHGGDRF